jgi:hypothetical protein
MSEEELKNHINMYSYSGGSSVMFAAAGGHVPCTTQLMELGADIKAIARATPEYLEKLVKMLEERSGRRTRTSMAYLHVAAQAGHLPCGNSY